MRNELVETPLGQSCPADRHPTVDGQNQILHCPGFSQFLSVSTMVSFRGLRFLDVATIHRDELGWTGRSHEAEASIEKAKAQDVNATEASS